MARRSNDCELACDIPRLSPHFLEQTAGTPVSHLWQHDPMIVAGSDIGIWIDFGSDEPGMILQREYGVAGCLV